MPRKISKTSSHYPMNNLWIHPSVQITALRTSQRNACVLLGMNANSYHLAFTLALKTVEETCLYYTHLIWTWHLLVFMICLIWIFGIHARTAGLTSALICCFTRNKLSFPVYSQTSKIDLTKKNFLRLHSRDFEYNKPEKEPRNLHFV